MFSSASIPSMTSHALLIKPQNLGMACEALCNVPACPCRFHLFHSTLCAIQLKDLLSVPPNFLLFAASEVSLMLFFAWNISPSPSSLHTAPSAHSRPAFTSQFNITYFKRTLLIYQSKTLTSLYYSLPLNFVHS